MSFMKVKNLYEMGIGREAGRTRKRRRRVVWRISESVTKAQKTGWGDKMRKSVHLAISKGLECIRVGRLTSSAPAAYLPHPTSPATLSATPRLANTLGSHHPTANATNPSTPKKCASVNSLSLSVFLVEYSKSCAPPGPPGGIPIPGGNIPPKGLSAPSPPPGGIPPAPPDMAFIMAAKGSSPFAPMPPKGEGMPSGPPKGLVPAAPPACGEEKAEKSSKGMAGVLVRDWVEGVRLGVGAGSDTRERGESVRGDGRGGERGRTEVSSELSWPTCPRLSLRLACLGSLPSKYSSKEARRYDEVTVLTCLVHLCSLCPASCGRELGETLVASGLDLGLASISTETTTDNHDRAESGYRQTRQSRYGTMRDAGQGRTLRRVQPMAGRARVLASRTSREELQRNVRTSCSASSQAGRREPRDGAALT